MALLSEASKEKEFDTRMLARNLAKGLVTHDEIAKNEKKLGDDGQNITSSNLDEMLKSVMSIRKALR